MPQNQSDMKINPEDRRRAPAPRHPGRRNIRFLGLTSFFTDWSSEMIFPLLPAFMAEVLGIPRVLIGLIEGVAQSLAAVIKVVSGRLSDRLARRKPLVTAGYALSSAAKPFFALVSSWPAVLLVRGLDRVGKGIRTAPRDALLGGAGGKRRSGRAFGFHRAMDTAGAVAGALTAFALMRWWPGSPYRWIFLLAAVPAWIGVVCVIRGVRETRRPSESRLTPALPRPVVWTRSFRFLLGSTLIFGLGNYTMTFFLLRAREMGVAAAFIPLTYLVFNVVYFLFAYPAGMAADRWGKKPVLAAGYLVYVATALGFALLDQAAFAWPLMAALGLYMAASDGTARALVSDISPEKQRGGSLGWYHSALGLVGFPSGLLAGALWDIFSSREVFIAGAILALAALTLLLPVREAGDGDGVAELLSLSRGEPEKSGEID